MHITSEPLLKLNVAATGRDLSADNILIRTGTTLQGSPGTSAILSPTGRSTILGCSLKGKEDVDKETMTFLCVGS